MFLCYGHLGTELFVDFTGKMSATIRGYYVWYFSVAKKELVQTASIARSLAHGMAVKC